MRYFAISIYSFLCKGNSAGWISGNFLDATAGSERVAFDSQGGYTGNRMQKGNFKRDHRRTGLPGAEKLWDISSGNPAGSQYQSEKR